MDDQSTIGARLRVLRRWRGMTQVEVAGLSGISQGWLSMVERGLQPLDRRSHIAAIAAALRVSETDLVGGPHLSADPQQSDPHTIIPPLRVALETNSLDEPLCERARPLEVLAAEVSNAIELVRLTSDFVAAGERLPDTLDELHVHTAAPADEAAYELALKTMVDACVIAGSIARDLGYTDLAHLSARRAGQAAASLDSPVDRGKAAYMRVLTMPKVGSWDRALAAAEKAADALEPHAVEPRGIEVLGMITLTAALAAAASNTGTASHWLDAAAELGRRVPDEPQTNWQSFSATNVDAWRVHVGVECGQAGGAVAELARSVDESKLGEISSRRALFLADVGRGLARDRASRGQAIRLLCRAENAAPQRIRNNVPVREAIAVMLQQTTSSAGGRELRGMAARMGVPH